MKRFPWTALLFCVLAVRAYAVDDNQTQPKATVQIGSAATPKRDDGDIRPRSGALEDKQQAVSRESTEYLQKLRKNTPFGTTGFDLAALRAGMGARREPSIKGIKFIRTKVGDIACEWVLTPGADPDLRLLYLHGGGFVSGSGGFYLTLAAHLSAAAKCAVLLPDYRLAPEHPFPAGLEDSILAHEWMIANGPSGAARSHATFIAGDSAGGSLTLATLLALRDRRWLLPAGGIALSPTTDLTLASNSLQTVNDPIISAHHARVPGTLSGEDGSPQPAGLTSLWRLPRHSAATDSGGRARDAPGRRHPGGEEGSFRRNPGEARSLARHVPCVPVPRAAAS